MRLHQAVFPVAYFGSVEYFAALISAQVVIFDIHENYRKQTLRNRCRIFSPNGIINLSVPVIKTAGNHTPVRDVKISSGLNWQTIHWRSIEAAYNSSPFFLYYKDDLVDFFNSPYPDLFELDIKLTSRILELAGCPKSYLHTQVYSKSYPDTLDLRESFNIKSDPSLLAFKKYHQVFGNKFGFQPNLSVLDILFNLGPETLFYLKNIDLSHLVEKESPI